jgi:hypothetical protein
MLSKSELEPDSRQIRQFYAALFTYADPNGFISLRVFPDDEDRGPPLKIVAVRAGDSEERERDLIIDDVIGVAFFASKTKRPAVFAPPLAVFQNGEHARKQDLLQALALSVECDHGPNAARARLEQLLGPATVVVRSGGIWTNGSGESEDKLHLHWRWDRPSTRELEKIKEARSLAQRIVNADASGKPICHPYRWPGSWHRKREPRLCEIAALNPEGELNIDAALEALHCCGTAAGITRGQDQADAQQDASKLCRDGQKPERQVLQQMCRTV